MSDDYSVNCGHDDWYGSHGEEYNPNTNTLRTYDDYDDHIINDYQPDKNSSYEIARQMAHGNGKYIKGKGWHKEEPKEYEEDY